MNQFVYMMKKPEFVTTRHIRQMHRRIVSHRFWNKRYKRGRWWYYGWVAFDRPIEDYDAMEAGLVPIFSRYKQEMNQ